MENIKGHEFKEIRISDSYSRRALQYKNKIILALKILGIDEDSIEIPLENNAMKKAQASAAWYIWDEHLFFSYSKSGKFVENLAMVSQVVAHFTGLLANGDMAKEAFIELFAEDTDIIKQRKEARKTLGVEEDSTDFEAMHKNYKNLSKEHHPDMPKGDTEKFKQINKAHKILKKELC